MTVPVVATNRYEGRRKGKRTKMQSNNAGLAPISEYEMRRLSVFREALAAATTDDERVELVRAYLCGDGPAGTGSPARHH